MRKRWIIVPLMAMLAGCGDPLAGVERVSDPGDIPDAEVAAALPSAEELNRDTSIFAGLFRRAEPEPEPLAVTASEPDQVGEAADSASEVLSDSETTDATAVPAEPEVLAARERRRGVLGWLRNAAASQAASDDNAETLAEPVEKPAPEIAADEIEPVTVAAAPDPSPRPRGLFRRAPPQNPAVLSGLVSDVPLGTVLPFGEIARVCEGRGRKLGTLVDHAARKGSDYKLYDTAPDSAAPRTFYVLGFSDNCPRQFTAALALFGTPQMHEQLRYGLPAQEYPYSTTDRAYEKVKSQVCRVGRSKPCGPRISRLEQTTVFVSTYENFKENARWADILLHEGAVLASALKSP